MDKFESCGYWHNPYSDLAVVKVKTVNPNFVTLILGDSSGLRVGDIITLEIIRGGETLGIKVQVGEKPPLS